ncbi:MAG TPA: glycosyltransferase family 2 protein [Puia sp.]
MPSTSARQPFSRPAPHLPPPGQALISCIMPTYNRREFIPHAIRYFLRQDYPNKELIVIDDGEDPVRDLVPVQEGIRYYRLERKLTLGAKLNLGCEYAQGDLIAHWDDDDWYAPRRLQYQEGELQKSHKSLCGINRLLYYDLRHHHALQYVYPQDQRVWLIGSSLFYRKELWLTHRFADINIGMDGLFVWSVPKEHIAVSQDPTISVHMIHDRNVSPKKTEGIWWTSHPVAEIQKIMDADYPFYSSWGLATTKNDPAPADIQHQPPPAKKLMKNIFACLVHERPDCIADLVNNLRYQDPSSIILLYNGGPQPDLLPPSLARDTPGVFIHPAPKVMQHGYLHDFALQCMEFALEQFDFDTLTIVDSDQLCLRKGYTEHLTDFFRSRQGPAAPGLLSGEPWRVTPANKTNLVAIQAFKEYDLWQSFVQTFPDGEQKFVHWTFWPSTVFTRDAIRDLVKLFRENRQLQEIMIRTKIWATEEVILPTLIRLLGYEIAANPCSYEYVRYKRPYTLQDIQAACRQEDAFWIHPIERAYDDPLRKYARQQCNNYSIKNDVPHSVKKSLHE